jgi:predicted acyl esterase
LRRSVRSFPLAVVLGGLGVLSAMWLAAPAGAAVPSVFGGDVACEVKSAELNGVRHCTGPTTTFDGTKIDVSVILPPEPASGPDGPYPLIGTYHGWGGSKIQINTRTLGWASNGYAVFSMTTRGWGNSCGGLDPDRLLEILGKCAKGYIHLMDTRYEVRDAQYLMSLLADQGLVQPKKIGAHGGSYGGGMSMALAALRNRVMNPDGSLSPWKSPGGHDMEIAVATPEIPWTDLANSLMPNGDTLDYVADAPYNRRNRIGTEKLTYVTGLYGTGLALGNVALPLTDPDADLTTWNALIDAGDPYDLNPVAKDLVEEVTTHHSSYYIDHSIPPAPLLISNGWTDDLFPVDEALRFYNRTRTEYPDSPIGLWFMDYGHARGQNKGADTAALAQRENAWFDHYLKGLQPAPPQGVTALTQTCPKDAASGGPHTAPTWASVAPGEIRGDAAASQTILPLVLTDVSRGLAYDPVAGQGACAVAQGSEQFGAANLSLPAAPESGYTLMGSPTVVADISSAGPASQIAARLIDVAPDGTGKLVARGSYRPDVTSAATRQVFQLHPNGYRFEAGHVAKLELLPNDVPYSRLSNLQLPLSVSNLQLRLPVLEGPGGAGGLSAAPAPKVVPAGLELARDFLPSTAGSPAPSPQPRKKAKRKARKCKKVKARKRGKAKAGKRAKRCKKKAKKPKRR